MAEKAKSESGIIETIKTIFWALLIAGVFRTLFFERYGALFPSPAHAALANGAVFGLAHLCYWNWVAIGLSTIGGLAFARLYQIAGPRRGLILCCAAHAAAGLAVISLGLHGHFTLGQAGG